MKEIMFVAIMYGVYTIKRNEVGRTMIKNLLAGCSATSRRT